jgi:hypothetical protein
MYTRNFICRKFIRSHSNLYFQNNPFLPYLQHEISSLKNHLNFHLLSHVKLAQIIVFNSY